MSQQFIDRAYLDIEGTVVECSSLTPNGEYGLESVKTMNRANRGRGWTSNVPDFELSAEVPLPHGGHSVDFDKIAREKTEFTATVKYDDGTGWAYLSCRVSRIEEPSQVDGGTVTNITIGALDRRPV